MPVYVCPSDIAEFIKPFPVNLILINKKHACIAKVCRRIDLLFIKARIESIEILRIQHILYHAKPFAEALIMNDFTFSQELDRISYIGSSARRNILS